MKYLHLLWRNLLRRKARTTFTFLSIVVAFFLFGLLMAIRNGFEGGVEIAGQNRLLTMHRMSIIQMLPERYLAQIQGTPGVRLATHLTWFGGIYQDPKNVFAQMAVEPDAMLRLYPEFILPADQRQRWLLTRTGAIAGRKLAARFGWRIGDRIPIQPTFWRVRDGKPDTFEFELVGIYRGATPDVDETQFFFRHDYLMERVGKPGLVGWYGVQVEDPARADEVARAIDRQFANSPAETKTATEKALIQSFANQVGDTGTMLTAISAIVFFVILLIAANTMAQAVRERTNELGVLKSLGFTDRGVMGLVLGEALLLSGTAGLTGLALVLLAVPVLAKLVEAFLPVFYVPARALVLGTGLAALLGLASGGVPAWVAQRLPIVEALRRR
ncbi:MAG TPA: FtsX-like permease family protein [Candidatus Binatia bacterium]|nr:FtsX-like permease family protein [Candidatus Binatia bacterium]